METNQQSIKNQSAKNLPTTMLSSKGQVIIPKTFRTAHHWDAGLELIATEMGDGILLRPKRPFEESTLEEVVGCLKYKGTAKTSNDIEIAMKRAAKGAWRDSN